MSQDTSAGGPQDDERRRRGQAERLAKPWIPPSGWRYCSEVNNTDVGIWYTSVAFLFLLFGGALALLMRAQLAVPGNDLLTADQYNQLFTMHGTVMMFLFAVPIFEAFSILILPPMMGAREMPFPRLSALGFWTYLIGGTFVAGSILFGVAPRGGWFMYPPLCTKSEGIGADIWLLGLSFIEIAATAAAVELIVGILECRAPGMRINLMPLYGWYILVVAGMILFAFPPLIAGDLLFEMERAFDWPFFDVERGGDPLLWQHLFWIFGHPEVYIIFLPAIALVAMIVPTFARRPIVGYSWIVLAAVGTGFLSFGLWVHHMYTTGLPGISLGFFSAASEAVAIPTGVQIFCFLATLLAGRARRSVPMLFVSGALAIFVLGGLTGVMLGIASFDFQAHDTYFIVAHLHYVLIGGMLFPVIAGLYYYYPIVSGKMLSDRLGTLGFWLMFVGFNVAFFVMHISGLRGMPRRVFTYPADLGLNVLNLIATVGAFILAAGILVIVCDVLRPKGRQPYCERNPWDAGTPEWLQEMPGKPWGVRSIPVISSRYPLWDQPNLMRDYDEGRFYLPDAEEGRREALITTVIEARPIQCLRVAGPSFLPMLVALFTGGFFIFPVYGIYTPALISGVIALGFLLTWLWRGTAEIPEKPEKDVGLGVTLPLYASGSQSVGWWGIFITMIGDMTAFASLIFGYFFYWTIHDDFPPDPALGPGVVWPATATACFAASWLLVLLARRWNRADAGAGVVAALGFAALLTAAAIAAAIAGPWLSGLDPTRHVYPATVWILVVWVVVHAGIGGIMQLYCLARRLAGRLSARHDIDIANIALYWHFMLITAVVTFAVLALFPLAA